MITKEGLVGTDCCVTENYDRAAGKYDCVVTKEKTNKGKGTPELQPNPFRLGGSK